MEELKQLFATHFSTEPETLTEICGSGSRRRYVRLTAGGVSAIGVVGTDPDENRAFLTIARSFRNAGIPVPEILAVSDDGMRYLEEDLGDESLFDRRSETELLLKTVSILPTIQFRGAEGLDFSVCYPQKEFDSRMVAFDLNYFKYCFLKLTPVEFNEIRLQDEFERLSSSLLACDTGLTFMYRDFQARNVMIRNGEPYFIDFQGGRRGPIYYDLASFVFQARAGYSAQTREALVRAYLAALAPYMTVEESDFRGKLDLFVLFRLLQVLGAYGFRGLYERKDHFLRSIDPAVDELVALFSRAKLAKEYPYLAEIAGKLKEWRLSLAGKASSEGVLEVEVLSFSYRKGLPADYSGNGGGYVFDCRGMHNPGRYEEYKKLTGRDEPVIKFLDGMGEAEIFVGKALAIVSPHVERYVKRGFSHLQVAFGCTGGQHRSVYCAEHFAAALRERYPEITVRLYHREQP